MDGEAALCLGRELFFAGSDTTVHGIANALYLLFSDPGLMAQVRADRTKALAALIEESLRLFNVVQYRHRICMADTMIGGTAIAKDEIVILVHAAANRDPDKYACPAQANITRRAPTEDRKSTRLNSSH